MQVGGRHRWPLLAIEYDVALLATYLWVHRLSAPARQRLLESASTNLDHLAHDPWVVLPASAFFTRGGLVACLIGSLICVGLLERVAGSRRTLAVAVAGHLVGTLVSEGVIAIRIHVGNLPAGDRYALDVGPSYVLVSCACAVLCWPTAPRWARVVAGVAVAPLFVLTAVRLPAGRIDAMGHTTAAVIGVAAALLARRRDALRLTERTA